MITVRTSLTPVLALFWVDHSATLSRSPFPGTAHLSLCGFCHPEVPSLTGKSIGGTMDLGSLLMGAAPGSTVSSPVSAA